MAEEDFPRGRSKLVTKKTQSEDNKEDDVTWIKEKKTGSKGFARKRQLADDSPFKQAKKMKMEPKEIIESPLQSETLCPHLSALACVRHAHDYHISLSLPGSHTASLPITDVSRAYSKQLKDIALEVENEASEDFSPSEELFRPGLLIPVVIKEIAEDSKRGRKMLTTSCDPSLINCNIPVNAIQDGMMLIGNVSSVEDHGYRIDLGVKRLQAFLKTADAKEYVDKYFDGRQLPVGLPLWCVLHIKGKSAAESQDTRVVNVSVAPKSVQSARIPQTSNLNAVLPGMKTDVVVETSAEHGLTVKFWGFQGIIHCSHLPRSAFSYDVGTQLTAVVLYVHPESKVIHLSALPHITDFEGGPVPLFGDLKMGDKMKASIHRIVRKKGLFLQLPNSIKGFAAMSQLSDGTQQPDLSKFKYGEEKECRAMGFNFMEGLVLVTLKESILNQKFTTVTEMKPGDLVEGTITEVLPNGVVVMLSRKVHSFISCIHLADVPIKQPEKKFEEGMKLKCRVMKVDVTRSKVYLTHKKSLLKSKYPLITDYSDLQPRMELEGVISSIGDKALHVNFFNNVWGYVLCKDMSTEKVEDPSALFYLGQVVRCRVLYCNAEEKKLKLSFNLGMTKPDKKHAEDKKQDKEKKELIRQTFRAGMVFQAKIVRVEKEAFRVSLLPDGIPALLPFCHLSDYHELQELRKLYLKPGHVVDEVTFFSNRMGATVTMKESFLQAVTENQFVNTFENLEDGMLLPGVIKNHQDYGVFLELAGGFIGLCPLKTLTDLQPNNLLDVLPPGQTVITRIIKVDKEKSRFLGSLRSQECFEGGLQSSLKYLDTFLTSRSQIMENLFESDVHMNSYRDLHVGSVIKVTVTSSHKKGVLCDVDKGLKALATHRHYGVTKPAVGQKYEAVVLCVDALAPCLEVSLDPKLVKAVKSRKENSKTKLKVGQVLKADLQLIKPDYLLMSLRAHGAGAFIHVPTKKIINDVYGTPAYKEGMYSEVVIKEIKTGFTIGVLKMNDPVSNKKEKTNFKKSLNHNMKIGAVFQAKVKNVHQLQMNIVTDSGIQGRVHITEVSDHPVEGKHPLHRYQPNDSVKVKVIGLRDVETQSYLPITHPKANRTLLECSMRESKMDLSEAEDLFSTSLSVSVGDEIFVYILQIASNKVWVQISPVHQGWIDFFKLSNDINVINDVHHHFKPGRAYKAHVIGSDKENKLILSFTGTEEMSIKIGSEINARITGLKPHECLNVRLAGGQFGVVKESPLKTDCVGKFIRCRVDAVSDSQSYELSILGDRQGPTLEVEDLPKTPDSSSKANRKRKRDKQDSYHEEQGDSGVDISKASSDSDAEKQASDVVKVKGTKRRSKAHLSIEGFSWSGDLKAEGDKPESEDDDDGDDDETMQSISRKLKKKKKRDEEKNIQEYERHQMAGDADLQSPSDFDRLVLQSPNSSVVWLRYMAYHMELGELEKARAVAERALTTIVFREEQEKKNVWLAYLNMETMYGNSDDVKKVLERAVAYNDPVDIYLKMCEIYVGADKMEDAEQLYHLITRKFKKDKSVWKSYSQFLYKAGRMQAARNLLQRCLTALEKKDHVEVISKFANLEFAHGDAERGRTMFENLIASYPGRTDIWSVYVDMVTKAGDIEGARQLLERAVKQKLNAKKLSFLVQKFIKFEETYGTEERVDKVKDLAVTLFES